LLALLLPLAYAPQARASSACAALHPGVNVLPSTPTSDFDLSNQVNGTVTHKLTGLMWQQAVLGPMSWSDALKAAKNSTVAGYTDWRLPNISELGSIVETCGYNPSINDTVFPDRKAVVFWSASSSVSNPLVAWSIDFINGSFFWYGKASSSPSVRLVRGGQSFDAFDAQPDSLPDIFTLTAQTGAALSSVATSNAINVFGVDAGTSISVASGTYKINNGSYTAASGNVSNGDTVTVQHTASSSTGTLTSAILTIGSSSVYFNVTTGIAQATLNVNAAPASLTYGGATATLTSSGGSGTGAVSYSAGLSTGCAVLGDVLSVTNASGTCAVTASKAGDGTYLAATSSAANVALSKGTQATLSITGPNIVTYGTPGTVTYIGGSGTGAVTFSAGGSTGCAVTPGTSILTVIRPSGGDCAVTATKAADNNYNLATSGVYPVVANPSPVPVCSLIAAPPRIQPDRASILTASCTPTATSYQWTGGTCAGFTSVNTCTVSPVASTSYGVTGINGNGPGPASTPVTVTVKAVDLTPILMLLLD
jgi:hypothetical protein